MDVAYATGHGRPLVALSSFDLQGVFVHAFLTMAAPTLYVGLAAVLWTSSILPRRFAHVALGLAIAFELLGFIGLFANTANNIAIAPLIGQSLWILAAAITMIRSRRLTTTS